ncbi:cold shock domain-containing protein [Pasteurella multocida]|uniref:cold shock domain-containing protein n=1 Tax=Pasteurella multocida TaxID=747 RepID=UPI0022B2299B|nr:cold shock domain-containing protein [Pasteurella multocida]MDX3886402.1 cold shock domain-containing protein [Pasteurella multocida]MDX3903872.1 cold shock domain-containing protein [Pasteurella multocida]MDX3964875.1 cold shock domain-containing protein [Pasteurella multocida]WRU39420.1 cold shock domain-containing protein [Pasteurella multocida]
MHFCRRNRRRFFAHYSVIEMEGYRSLKAGQKVQFEVVHGDKGSHATKIIPIVE